MLRMTEIDNRIESASAISECYLDLAPSNSLAEILSRDTTVIVEHGASGDSTVYAVCLNLDSVRRNKSEAAQAPVIDRAQDEAASQDIAPGLRSDIIPPATQGKKAWR